MKLPAPLVEGKLVRRYQRFLADIELPDGRVVIAHTPNTGSMLQCAVAGHPVLISRADNPARKLDWTLELILVNGHWVDTHTHRTNRVVEEALRAGEIAGLAGYQVIAEQRFGTSRLDFLLQKGEEKVYLEVKNVTLTDGGAVACFPDAVTERGRRHLHELLDAVRQGDRAVIFFLVQRGEAAAFSPADQIDPAYGRTLREVAAQGVEVIACRSIVTREENRVGERLPVIL
ncbi:MAG: DNA/RNA nuclease SfsA [Desulfuromonadales bacterium]|nr:DNA/RNA nuclease SfsA [Desulfuromonadales bacterium]